MPTSVAPVPGIDKSVRSGRSICAELRRRIGHDLVRMTSIDRLDADLIELLTIHPRIGIVELARRLGVARGTVQSRMAKLAERGAVTGFGPQVDPVEIGYPVLAFIFLEIAQGRLAEAVQTLEAVPEVLEAHGTTGARDLLCRVVARDNGHLQQI